MLPDAPEHRRLAENLAAVRAAMAAACAKAGRPTDAVRLVAVTKYVSAEIVQRLLALGVRDLGESRVQQLVQRAAQLGTTPAGWDAAAADSPRWHLIGHLQRNKVRAALQCTRVIHSLDSVRLTQALRQHAASLGVQVDAFLEVNLAGEANKTGALPADVAAIVQAVGPCNTVRLCGLMTMAPYDPDPETARRYFAGLRELLERLQRQGDVPLSCRQLSMGMSHDFGIAIEEGATCIRVGAALFEGVTTPPSGHTG